MADGVEKRASLRHCALAFTVLSTHQSQLRVARGSNMSQHALGHRLASPFTFRLRCV